MLLQFLAALKISGISALGLFQHCAGHGIVGVTRLLHSTNVRDQGNLKQLIELLGHKRFPFDYVYTYGCENFMTKRRMKELSKATAQFYTDEIDRNLLLPLHCVKPRDVKFELFDPGHYFNVFPADTRPLPSMKSKHFFWHLKKAIKTTGLIQNCNWLYQIGAPRIYQMEPPRIAFGTHGFWSAIHHSCYIMDTTKASAEIKFSRLMENLVREYPLLALNLKEDDISEHARWCLHLSLILLNLRSQYEDMNQSGASIIRDYLVNFETQISKHLERVETCSLRIYMFELIQFLLSMVTEFYGNNRMADVYGDFQLPESKRIDFDATLELLLKGLETDREKTRWILCFLELIHIVDPYFWKNQRNSAELFEDHVSRATPLEQYNWTRLYLKTREIDTDNFGFAPRPILTAVQSNQFLMTRLLRELSLNNPRQLGFLLCAVPHERRLKEVRYRHLADRPLQRKIGKMQSCYAVNCRTPSILKTVAYQLIRYMEDGLLLEDENGGNEFHLNGDISLAFVSLQLSLMALYQCKWYLELNMDQVALLLSRKSSSPTEVFKSIRELSTGERRKVHDRLKQAQSMALRVLPRLLSLDEILVLLLPKSELLTHKLKTTYNSI